MMNEYGNRNGYLYSHYSPRDRGGPGTWQRTGRATPSGEKAFGKLKGLQLYRSRDAGERSSGAGKVGPNSLGSSAGRRARETIAMVDDLVVARSRLHWGTRQMAEYLVHRRFCATRDDKKAVRNVVFRCAKAAQTSRCLSRTFCPKRSGRFAPMAKDARPRKLNKRYNR